MAIRLLIAFTVLIVTCPMSAQKAAPCDESQVRPPVTDADLRIAKRAKEILDSPAKWNRADDRKCPADAKTFSLYCAIEMATDEVTGNFEHRGAAMQEARFVIDGVAPNAKNYEHRLMGYNNDPGTTFADIQRIFNLLEASIAKRLKEGPAAGAGQGCAPQSLATAQLQIMKRVREILDSPSRWNRASAQTCEANAQTFGLYCAFDKATREISGEFDGGGAAMQEVRHAIDEMAPNHAKYPARLVDYNNDPRVSFADLQKLLQVSEERLAKRLAADAQK